jgi:heptaprenylglyceryl phosphate synthase
LINFRLSLSEKLLITNDNESILQRIDDYQLIINVLNSQEKDWTNETTDKLINKLEKMVNIF